MALVSIILIAPVIIINALEGKIMPYLAAWVTEFGVFTDQIIVGQRQPVTGDLLWVFLTIVTTLAAIALLSIALSKCKAIWDIFLANEDWAKKIQKAFFAVGFLCAAVSLFLLLGKKLIFRYYITFYNYLYHSGYVKKPLEYNFHKIIALHNNLLVWLIILALLSFIFAKSKSSLKGKLALYKNVHKIRELFHSPAVFIYLNTLFQLAAIFFMKDLSDRYLVVLIPGTVIFILSSVKKLDFSKALFAGLLSLCFIYSVLITSDTFAWNRAAWQGGEYLKNQGIPLKQIYAGLAWNGWYFDKPIHYALAFKKARSANPMTVFLRDIFTETDNEYTVSSSGIIGYETIKNIPYRSLLTLLTNKNKYIYVLHRRQK